MGNRFWRAMDPTPTTEVNEYYKEFRKWIYFEIYNLTKKKACKADSRLEYEILQSTGNGNFIADAAAKIASFFRGSEVKKTTALPWKAAAAISLNRFIHRWIFPLPPTERRNWKLK